MQTKFTKRSIKSVFQKKLKCLFERYASYQNKNLKTRDILQSDETQGKQRKYFSSVNCHVKFSILPLFSSGRVQTITETSLKFRSDVCMLFENIKRICRSHPKAQPSNIDTTLLLIKTTVSGETARYAAQLGLRQSPKSNGAELVSFISQKKKLKSLTLCALFLLIKEIHFFPRELAYLVHE